MSTGDVDFDRFRLRRLVERLTEPGEVGVHDEPVALADLSSIIGQKADTLGPCPGEMPSDLKAVLGWGSSSER